MYDYVLQYGFDTESKYYIQSIKDYLKNNRIIVRERNWLPHINIDLYNCKNEKEFIDKLDVIVEKISTFNIEFKNSNTCNNETLYIEPYNKEILMELNNYMLEKRRERKYIPHATICTSDTLDKSIQLANQKFNPFISTIKYIWVYNRDMQLIKEYNLK